MKQNIVDDCLSNTEPVPAVLLVGGMGTRLRSVIPSTPKPLAPVGNNSFLELLVRQLRHQGIRRLVMCTGYLADQIEDEFNDGRSWDIQIEYSKEPCPLGTAGAIKLAQRHLSDSPTFLVMNGDSFLETDFHQLIKFHHEREGLATIAAMQVTDGARYGRVHMSPDGRVVGFEEKTGDPAAGLVSAGVYVFNRAVFDHIPEGPSSLEKNVFPRLLSHGIYALVQRGMFIDIGTPDDYAQAQELCDRLYGVALDRQYAHSHDLRVKKA
jgi:D-glycero-alpha-D-manno-heptose 1-phosphate guanylyltransferase